MLYLCISDKGCPWREDISTLPFRRHIGRDSINGVMWHEMMDIQITNIQCRIIPHRIGIEVAFCLYHTFTLTHDDIGKILGTISSDKSFSSDTTRNTIVALDVLRKHTRHKTEIFRTSLKLYFGTQTLRVCHISGKTSGSSMESSG